MTDAYARDDEYVAGFWDAYAAERGGLRYVARHPVLSSRGIRAMRRLPLLDASPSATTEGRHLDTALRKRGPGGRPFVTICAAALALPEDPETFTAGRRMQTLRRKVRQATAAGVRVRAVLPEEKPVLLALANDAERMHPDPVYRVEEPHNDDLLDCSIWLVAEDAQQTPLLLAVLAVDGEWASLRYFRTQHKDEIHSLSRWSAMVAVVAAARAAGVRHLLDPEPPAWQQPGVRHFQRMVGFRFVRIRLPATRVF